MKIETYKNIYEIVFPKSTIIAWHEDWQESCGRYMCAILHGDHVTFYNGDIGWINDRLDQWKQERDGDVPLRLLRDYVNSEPPCLVLRVPDVRKRCASSLIHEYVEQYVADYEWKNIFTMCKKELRKLGV